MHIIYTIFITHSSTGGQLVWFQSFAITDKAAGVCSCNLLMDFSVWIMDRCAQVHPIVSKYKAHSIRIPSLLH